MTDYKLVPFEPTPEMVSAAEDAYMPFGDMDLALRMAMLAAPDVQGEPDVPALAEVLTSDLSARINRVSKRSLDGSVVMYSEEWNGIVELVKKLLIAAPQPTPDVEALVDALEKSQRELLEAVDSMRGTCGVRYGNTPLDEDIYTHDKWAEDFLQERAEAARAAIDAAMHEENK